MGNRICIPAIPACALFERPCDLWCLCAVGLAEILAASVGLVAVVAKTWAADVDSVVDATDVLIWLLAVVDEAISVDERIGAEVI